MFCTACGTQNGDDGRFCKQCGKPLERPVDGAHEETNPILLERAYQARRDGHLDRSLTICRLAVDHNDKDTSAWSLLGQIYEEMGKTEEALNAYEKVVALNPGSIADRIKLDELRGEAPPASERPHVSLASPIPQSSGQQSAPRYVAASLVFLGLAIVASAIYITNRPIQVTAPTAPGNVARNNTTPPVTAPTKPAAPVQSSNQSADPRQYGIGSLLPPTVIYEQPPSQPSMPAQVYSPPLPNIKPETKAGASRTATPGGHSKIVIDVGKHSSASAETTPGEKIELQVGASPSTDTPPAHPNQNARSYMAVAQAEQVQGEYQKAIAAYTSALPTAADDQASIYQQIALCYQHLHDYQNAVTNYQQAIHAYNALVSAGKRAVESKFGIQACEAGIKTCSLQ